MRALPLLVLVALAGCLGGEDDPGPTPADRDGTPDDPPVTPPLDNGSSTPSIMDLLLSFEMSGCQGITVMQDVPVAEVQSLLPDGFVAAPSPFTADAGNAVLAIDMFLCDQLATPSAQVNATAYGQTYTFIERPAAAFPSAPEGVVHEYVFGVLGGEDQLPVVWEAAGYRSHGGPVTYTPVNAGPTGVRMETYAFGDYSGSALTHGLAGTAAGAEVDQDFARYTVLEDGSLLLWTGHYALPGALVGVGTYSVPADDPFAAYEDAGGLLRGVSLTYPSGDMTGMDLTRYFPPFE